MCVEQATQGKKGVPSRSLQPFTIVHLNISNEKIHSVEEALNDYTAHEEISGIALTPTRWVDIEDLGSF